MKRQTGVTFSKTEDRWLVRFCGYYIGRFRTFDEAVAARKGFEKAGEVWIDTLWS
jgi:hypothetical protein